VVSSAPAPALPWSSGRAFPGRSTRPGDDVEPRAHLRHLGRELGLGDQAFLEKQRAQGHGGALEIGELVVLVAKILGGRRSSSTRTIFFRLRALRSALACFSQNNMP